MEEGKTPQTTYIPGDTVSFGFQFSHSTNTHHVIVAYINAERQVQMDLVGYPELVHRTPQGMVSKVEVSGDIEEDTPPGKYELRLITLTTITDHRSIMREIPQGMSFWVDPEPKTPPLFLKFTGD